MPFAPRRDYKVYNAAVENRMRRNVQNIDEQFRRYAAYYDTIRQSRQKLPQYDNEKLVAKHEKIRAHTRLVELYRHCICDLDNEK